MAAKKKKRQKPASKLDLTSETPAGEALTVAWTVTVTMLLFCNLVVIAAHFYLLYDPAARGVELLCALMLLGSSIIGVISLLILPILYRIRRIPPPLSFVVFGICLAIAPILAILLRTLS